MIKVTRIRPNGELYEPAITRDEKYQLADPKHGRVKHFAEHAIFAETLEEAVEMIESRGFALWMKGKETNQRNLISASEIKIERV